jgi:hypothetical protein
MDKIAHKLVHIERVYHHALKSRVKTFTGKKQTDVPSNFVLLFELRSQKEAAEKLAKRHGIALSKVFINTSNKPLSKKSGNILNLAFQVPYFEDISPGEIRQVADFLMEL